jgi:hypothetical protein
MKKFEEMKTFEDWAWSERNEGNMAVWAVRI